MLRYVDHPDRPLRLGCADLAARDSASYPDSTVFAVAPVDVIPSECAQFPTAKASIRAEHHDRVFRRNGDLQESRNLLRLEKWALDLLPSVGV